MRLLLDQDVWAVTARFLREAGHDIVTVSSIGHAQSDDSDLLTLTQEQNRIFVTRDRDFGELVFVRQMRVGVIYLRLLPSTQDAVHEELKRVLNTYTEAQLHLAFVVVEPGRHRFRRLTGEMGEKSEL